MKTYVTRHDLRITLFLANIKVCIATVCIKNIKKYHNTLLFFYG